jgi:hypothetical protein
MRALATLVVIAGLLFSNANSILPLVLGVLCLFLFADLIGRSGSKGDHGLLIGLPE